MADYKREDDIALLQNELMYYKPGEFIVPVNKTSQALPSQIRCAVFGHKGVGKSSFINSIFYAVTNRWDAPAKEGSSDDEASITPRWEPINVAKSIVVYYNRDTATVNTDYLREVESEVEKRDRVREETSYWDGVRKSLEPHARNFTMTGPNNNEMHCVVIVVSAESIMAGMRADVWSDLIDRVEDISGYMPMFVITHHSVAGDDKPLARKFKSILGALRIDEDDIFWVENYTRDSHSRDEERHLQFLNILLRMVANGEKAIHKEHRPQRPRVVYRVPLGQRPRIVYRALLPSDQRPQFVDRIPLYQRPQVVHRVPSYQRPQVFHRVPSDQGPQVVHYPGCPYQQQNSNCTQKSRNCIII